MENFVETVFSFAWKLTQVLRAAAAAAAAAAKSPQSC